MNQAPQRFNRSFTAGGLAGGLADRPLLADRQAGSSRAGSYIAHNI